MAVILFVTRETAVRQVVGERVIAMTGIALLLGVLAVEHEVCIASVVETRIEPAGWFVAIAALIAAAPVVGIVLGVTAKTGSWRVGERIVGVAVEAGRLLVFANQRETGCAVVKLHVPPASRSVAVAALRTERPRMRVVVFMA